MSSEAEAEAPASAAAAPTSVHAEIVAELQATDGFVEHAYSPSDAVVRVAPSAWRETGRICKERLGLSYLGFIAGIDWKLAPDLGATKIWDPDAEATADPGDGPGHWTTGLGGGDTRFQVFARLHDLRRHMGITLKVDAGDDEPRAESWVPLFRGADWHEREAWEMYGIEFDGHPGLRHLYLPGEFEGHPLRKDFPLLAREVKPWPGLVNVEGLPGEEDSAEDASAAGSGDEVAEDA